eukprot:5687023-Prymnesium_polylepis.2
MVRGEGRRVPGAWGRSEVASVEGRGVGTLVLESIVAMKTSTLKSTSSPPNGSDLRAEDESAAHARWRERMVALCGRGARR